MPRSKLIKTEEGNIYLRGKSLPKGCKLCLKGQKAVLFLNGICQKPEHCHWYCPLSMERKNNKLTFINEIEITSNDELLKEISITDAKGLSITGGEPLSKLNLTKTLEYLKFIKNEKGSKFHIHLYTNGINFSESIAMKLASAGLDEIRFHPSKPYRMNIKYALNLGLDVGAEVPVIPDDRNVKELEEFINFLNVIGADFINLNEFEFCFPNSQNLKNRGYQLKRGSIASVIGSYEIAFNIVKKLSSKVSLKLHFCPIHSKDYYQLKNRYLKRAKHVRLPLEVITDEGLLLFGQIEGENQILSKFYDKLLLEMKIDKNLISFKEDQIKLPFYISIDDSFISLLEKFKLKGYIVEITPFREKKYQQITEKNPIKLFKKEFGFDESKKR
ncbi:MAG: radical SAM protein [Promethearchaeota archaeon]|jgi:pyruvate formate-lyase activating enzyme-like uncharacterized protein